MSNHVVITGTGRAGTSFLVQYLANCGLETHLASNPAGHLDEHAHAGLEDLPYDETQLPYVIKSPWLYELADYIVKRTDLTFDAVIIPMRDIVDAATSRVVIEMRARYGNAAIHPEVARWESWGVTPGGIVYSMNPMDQARILALGFHEIVRALTKKNVPIIFLDFPLLIEDGTYLWSKLEPILSRYCTRDQALNAHSKLADPDKVRVGKETSDRTNEMPSNAADSNGGPHRISYPSHDELDRAALMRELQRLRREVASREATIDSLQRDRDVLTEQVAPQINILRQQLAQVTQDAETARIEYEAEECRRKSQQLEANARASELESALADILNSRSWRFTAPLRRMGSLMKSTPKTR